MSIMFKKLSYINFQAMRPNFGPNLRSNRLLRDRYGCIQSLWKKIQFNIYIFYIAYGIFDNGIFGMR